MIGIRHPRDSVRYGRSTTMSLAAASQAVVADAGQRLRCLTCSPSRRDLPWSQALVSVCSASSHGHLGVNPFAMVAGYSCATWRRRRLLRRHPSHILTASFDSNLDRCIHSLIPSFFPASRTLLHLLLSSNIPLQSPLSQAVLLSSATQKNSNLLFGRSCSTGCEGEGVEWRGVEWPVVWWSVP